MCFLLNVVTSLVLSCYCEFHHQLWWLWCLMYCLHSSVCDLDPVSTIFRASFVISVFKTQMYYHIGVIQDKIFMRKLEYRHWWRCFTSYLDIKYVGNIPFNIDKNTFLWVSAILQRSSPDMYIFASSVFPLFFWDVKRRFKFKGNGKKFCCDWVIFWSITLVDHYNYNYNYIIKTVLRDFHIVVTGICRLWDRICLLSVFVNTFLLQNINDYFFFVSLTILHCDTNCK